MLKIIEICENKKKYIELLLLADEQESMIDKYLQRGSLYILEEDKPIGVCVVTDEGNGIVEIKNIAIHPDFQGKGYGKILINYICNLYKGIFKTVIVGTGDSPLTVPFYEKCGFVKSHIVKNFFTDNYDHPIFECGKQLIDMVYLKREI